MSKDPYAEASRRIEKIGRAVERGARAAEREGAESFATTASALSPVLTGALRLSLSEAHRDDGTVKIADLAGTQDPSDYYEVVARDNDYLKLAHGHLIGAMPGIARRAIASEVAVEVGRMKGKR